MGNTDPSERTRELKRMVRDELEDRDDVKAYELVQTTDPGMHLVIEQEYETRRYHITLERHPDGDKRTHWSYVGPDKGD